MDSMIRALERSADPEAALAYARAMARREGIRTDCHSAEVLGEDDHVHRLGASSRRTICGLWARDVTTIDAPYERWLAAPWRQALDALRICEGCIGGPDYGNGGEE